MQLFQVVSVSPAGNVSAEGFVTLVHASKWPVSYSVEMFVCSAAHGVMPAGEAVLYSGWKLCGVPEQSTIEVFWKPLRAEACMKPVWPVFWSVTTTLKALADLPGTGASNMCTVTVSPGFISSVLPFGLNVERLASCGLGGPVGRPLVWMNAKFTGSTQLLLQVANPSVHSRLSIVNAAHQWVLSQLMESANTSPPANPGG
jgi:hypothetical protein